MAGNVLRSPDTCFQVNRHIGLFFGERLDTLFTSSDSKISGFTRPQVIGFVADLFFSNLESGFLFFRIRQRPRPHLSGYFPIRNFFFPDTATVNTYTANSTANPKKRNPLSRVEKNKSATNPEGKSCGFKNVWIRVDGA